jgi:tetrapyrrole methylase family protein/MazG family protein
MEDFYELIKKLRKECPWDASQTQKSLIPFLLEETYELIDAIERNDKEKIAEELGDVMLNLLMQMVIMEEKGRSAEEIIKGIETKVIKRHPHVFEKKEVKDSEEVVARWQQIKKQERPDSILSEVPMTLPSLLLAQRLQRIASSVGFDWENRDGVFDKLNEEIDELHKAEGKEHQQEELGDILFVLSHLGNFMKIDTELALRHTCEKFKQRFKAIEEGLKKRGKTFADSNLDEMETLWQQAKERKDSRL